MKWLFSVLVVGCLVFTNVGLSRADENWIIEDFYSVITLEKDGSAVVEEAIKADFGALAKHGIYRDIPDTFLDRYGNKFKTTITPLSVTDDMGNAYRYEKQRVGDEVRLKIGDPDRTISGEQTYIIKYEIERVINFFETHDEFYWNVTGNAWPVPIRLARVTIMAPASSTDALCFTGVLGSAETNCEVLPSINTQVISSTQLDAGEGLTAVVSYPVGTFVKPTLTQLIWRILVHNWGYFIPVVMLFGLFWLYWQEGRDRYYVQHFAEAQEARVPLFVTQPLKDTYYPPTEVTAAEAGVIVDETVHHQDIAAILISLANKKALTIVDEGKKNYRLIKTNNQVALKPFGATFFEGIFGTKQEVTLKALKYTFTSTANKVKGELYKELTQGKYFYSRPDRVRTIYGIIGITLGLLGFKFIAVESLASWGISVGIGVLISGILVLIFSRSMPRRTAKGRRVLEEVLGLKRVIQLGAYRQEIFEKHNYFTEILPFAIAFGLTKQWAQTVEKLSIEKPEWFQSQGSFSAVNFSQSMQNFSKTSAATLTAVKSNASGGGSGFSGGSSGGGFGGGGGGSW